MTQDDSVVVDDRRHHRFVYRQDGVEARLVYRTDGDRLTVVPTEVPEAISGRGIGGRLVQAAVDRAAATGETVVPWCPYARKWLTDHPDRSARVGIDWGQPPEATGAGRGPGAASPAPGPGEVAGG
jgi:predicted GNAT family acetyltransferase